MLCLENLLSENSAYEKIVPQLSVFNVTSRVSFISLACIVKDNKPDITNKQTAESSSLEYRLEAL